MRRFHPTLERLRLGRLKTFKVVFTQALGKLRGMFRVLGIIMGSRREQLWLRSVSTSSNFAGSQSHAANFIRRSEAHFIEDRTAWMFLESLRLLALSFSKSSLLLFARARTRRELGSWAGGSISWAARSGGSVA